MPISIPIVHIVVLPFPVKGVAHEPDARVIRVCDFSLTREPRKRQRTETVGHGMVTIVVPEPVDKVITDMVSRFKIGLYFQLGRGPRESLRRVGHEQCKRAAAEGTLIPEQYIISERRPAEFFHASVLMEHPVDNSRYRMQVGSLSDFRGVFVRTVRGFHRSTRALRPRRRGDC